MLTSTQAGYIEVVFSMVWQSPDPDDNELGRQLPISFSLIFDTEKLEANPSYVQWAKSEIDRYINFQGE